MREIADFEERLAAHALANVRGAIMRPKDAQRTKTGPESQRTLSIIRDL
jgi:hypothetical protein